MEINIGDLVSSIAGHDKEGFYIVVGTDEKNVYISDGKYKLLDKPKRKNKKHICVLKHSVLLDGLSDLRIKRVLKEYKAERMEHPDSKQEII